MHTITHIHTHTHKLSVMSHCAEAKNRSQQLQAPEIVRALTELFLAVENQAEVLPLCVCLVMCVYIYVYMYIHVYNNWKIMSSSFSMQTYY